MTAWDYKTIRNLVLAGGLGLACAMPGFAQEDNKEPVGLFEEDGKEMDGQDVEVDSLGQIDITVKDLEITKVLQLLSIQSQRNIVASRNVSGKVSADLYGVSFHEALEAILTPNGYGYEEKGNFIYIYTAAELEERRNAMRKTMTKVVRLNYLSSAEAAAFVTPLLSQNGAITASEAPEAGILPSESDAGENSFAHPDTLVIRDYEENIDEIQSILSQLDIRPKQVLIEATILQATLTERNAFGVDFAVFANFDALDFANPLNAIDELISGGDDTNSTGGSGSGVVSTAGNVATGANSVKVGVVGSDAAVFLRALDSVTDNTVLAKPNILVLNKQRADLLVGQRLGYLSTTVTDTSETQTIEFLDIGTQLTVRPWISEEGTIRLELRPSVSDGATRLEGGFIIPDQTTQELVTNIIVESGQTVVLGGLFKEDTSVGRNQVPGLGDIPILGSAFKGQDDSLDRSEVIFMVKTTVMDHSTLAVMGESAEERITDARIGIRNGLLPFSTDKLVSAHLLNARQHIDEGDDKAALWDVNIALHLSPTSADALALKEQITGEQVAYFDRSIFAGLTDGIIDTEMQDLKTEPLPEAEEAEPVAAQEQGEENVADATEASTLEVELSSIDVIEVEANQPVASQSEPIVIDVPVMYEVEAEQSEELAAGDEAQGETLDMDADGNFTLEEELSGVDTMYDNYE